MGGGLHCEGCARSNPACGRGEPQNGKVCPKKLNAPITPAEREVLALIGARSAWILPEHPRLLERDPALNWAAVQAAHDPYTAPWNDVRQLLRVVERAARTVGDKRRAKEI